MKKLRLSALLLAALLSVSACTKVPSNNPDSPDNSDTPSTPDNSDTNNITSNPSGAEIDTADQFTSRDFEIGYDESASALIILEGDTASCASDAVKIDGALVQITDGGTYVLRGTLNDGMIIVNADKTDKIQLVLDGAKITSATSAALYVLQADKVFITLEKDTENSFTNGGTFTAIDDSNIDAALFSKDDITLNGEGKLCISSPAGHGIVTKDDLVITSGSYEISAQGHALSGKQSVRISNGSFKLDAGKDGVHSEDKDDASLGYIYVTGGVFDITADGDGISADNTLQIDGGSFKLYTGGGAASVTQSSSGGFMWNPYGGMSGYGQSTSDSVSAKGIKASGKLVVNGGDFEINSADDCLHSNSALSLYEGSFILASGDDAIHSDKLTAIYGGKIDITKSYEGIEGLAVEIAGGEISLVSSDDGINSAGGNDQSGMGGFGGFGGGKNPFSSAANDDCYIKISGGKLNINAAGDGIDSNGSVYVSGGETYLSGPTSSANGALDYESSAAASGGIFVAIGASGMAASFGSGSTQGAIGVVVDSCAAGTEVILKDAEGKVLVSYTSEKAFNHVVITHPEIKNGETYTLLCGDYTKSITMSSLTYSEGGMGGGMPGGMGGGGKPSGRPF